MDALIVGNMLPIPLILRNEGKHAMKEVLKDIDSVF